MEKRVVHQFQRNKEERICISVGTYKDKTYIDMRVFFTDQVTGELRPTKKGLTIAQNLLPQLKHGLSICENGKKDPSYGKAHEDTHNRRLSP